LVLSGKGRLCVKHFICRLDVDTTLIHI